MQTVSIGVLASIPSPRPEEGENKTPNPVASADAPHHDERAPTHRMAARANGRSNGTVAAKAPATEAGRISESLKISLFVRINGKVWRL